MTPELYNLSWNEFETGAINTFKQLFGQTDFVDVTLVSEDLKQIKAHKVILSACSSILKKILQQNPQQQPIIYLTGVAHKEMQSMVNFMYLGQTEVEQDGLNHFMEVAAKFDVKGLSQRGKDSYENFTDQTDEKSFSNDEQNFEEYNTIGKHRMEFLRSYDTAIVNNQKEDDEHSAVKDEQFQTSDAILSCEFCDYKSGRAYSIKVHKMAKHDGVNFPCDQCEYKSTFANNLTRHKKKQHSQKDYISERY